MYFVLRQTLSTWYLLYFNLPFTTRLSAFCDIQETESLHHFHELKTTSFPLTFVVSTLILILFDPSVETSYIPLSGLEAFRQLFVLPCEESVCVCHRPRLSVFHLERASLAVFLPSDSLLRCRLRISTRPLC